MSGWARAIAGLVLVIWLIPTQKYTLPVNLPFNLEPYRLVVLALLAALLVGVLIGTARLSAAAHGRPVVLLAVAALASQAANWSLITSAGLQTQALKSLSYFLSFLLAFVIVCSTLKSLREIDGVLRAIVVGAFVVAVGALYESRYRSNLFDNLDNYLQFLREHREDRTNVRGGRLRVRASAHHPIALAGALTICVPLAIYLAGQAASAMRRRIWLLGALVIMAGAFSTVSRTVVSMLVAMFVVALFLRGRQLLRWWPVVILLAGFIHFAAPGSITHIYWALTPSEGLIAEQQGRAGASGSGRVADLGPALDRWRENPLLGRGLGLGKTTGEAPRGALSGGREESRKIIFDDQYLAILVGLGLLGFIGAVWFVWGAVVKLVRSARRTVGQTSNRLTAIAIACTGYGAGMVTYDSFAFVQVTFLFFVIAALGLRARAVQDA